MSPILQACFEHRTRSAFIPWVTGCESKFSRPAIGHMGIEGISGDSVCLYTASWLNTAMILVDSLPSKSGRIALVPPQEADDAAVAALRCHPETRRYLRFFPAYVSVEQSRELRIARAADPARISFNIHVLASGSPSQFVGMASITHINNEFKSCDIGILICPEYFRGGLATDALYTVLSYAFEEQNFHRVGFSTAADNAGMRGWLDWAGATLEGINRESWSDGNGGFTDVCLYSILEREWKETVKDRLEGRIHRKLES